MSEIETEEDLRALKPGKRAVAAATKLAETAEYTTVALRALAQFHRDADDAVGARLLDSYASEFAEHEFESA